MGAERSAPTIELWWFVVDDLCQNRANVKKLANDLAKQTFP